MWLYKGCIVPIIMYNYGMNKVAEKFSKYLKILFEKGIIKCTNPRITTRSYYNSIIKANL